MSIARHHNEWLSLLEVSGPFLSMPVLMRVFPQGLEAHDSEISRELRLAHEEWADNQQGLRPDPAMHTLWVRFVLERALDYSNDMLAEGPAIPSTLRVTFAEHGESLQPDLVLHEPSNLSKPRMLIQVYPSTQNLEKALTDKRWKVSCATRMMELLRATNVRLGLITNGEQWMLVDVPRGETSAFISWYATLWFDEPLTLRALRSLLSARRFFSVADDDTLEGMLAASLNEQQEVTDQLGYQVRRAVEVLIRSIDHADQDGSRKLLENISEPVLYEAALTVMMRLVFLLSAEERGLLLLGDPIYDQYYAISTLRAQLREVADQHGEEVLERRFDAWCRLLATFRAVYSGIQHDRLRMPAYGGSLFSPDRFPFLEGRAKSASEQNDGEATPLPINNRTVLHLLEALQILRVKVPGGGPAEARRLSFRSLDVEQIGHVYEGLLDHVAVRASEPVLGLSGTRDKEPEVSLSTLKGEQAKGPDAIVAFLKDATGRTPNAIQRSLESEPDSFQSQQLKSACGNDLSLYEQVLPFAGMIREDDFGFPAIYLPGSVYVTAGPTRRATGTHYTPRSLTEPIVQHTLEPLIYIGPAEGAPREAWKLQSPAEILALKVCDMAMGSAGFLVQVIRYLGERLVEAWENASEGGIRITPEGMLATGSPGETIIPRDLEERLILARRLVADRCVYGVDKNPLAVEIAKLSIWLVTMDKGRPFSFLDHALKCGDSLVGASANDYLRWAHGYQSSTMTLFDEQLRLQLETARQKRRELEAFEVKDVRDAENKAALLKEADAAMEHIKRGCDLLSGAQLLGLSAKETEDLQLNLLLSYMAGELDGTIDPDKHYDAARALTAAQKERVFHWEFEFPEVFENDGFNVFVGNPPFIGGGKISTLFGDGYFGYLRQAYTDAHGQADICAFFFLKAFANLSKPGSLGLIATNTISQGDTRESSLETIIAQKGILYLANSDFPWPGEASVSISIIHFFKGSYNGQLLLNGSPIPGISAMLDGNIQFGKPFRLQANSEMIFSGSKLDAIGFVIEPSEADSLIKNNSTNKNVIFPFLGGEDFNKNPDQHPSRWAINFFDWPLEKANEYPEIISIVKKRVYPQRQKNKRAAYRDFWWQYAEKRVGLHESISNLNRVLVCCVVTKYLSFAFVPKGWIYSKQLAILARENALWFSILQSTVHEIWARKYSSTLETRLSYTLTDCFETFPFPKRLTGLEQIGESYHEHRRELMISQQEGLTDTYNRFHDPNEIAEDIVRLRELHVEMDNAVAGAYGWSDLELGHDFHETAQGIRFTVSESARREVLSRLLKLNHERYEEEQKAAGESKVEGRKSAKGKSTNGQMELL